MLSKEFAAMSNYAFDNLVFIGRFQPFHRGHLQVIQSALLQSQNIVILCGSAHQPRSTRNPWTVEEREQMIRGCFDASDNNRISIAPLPDATYNDDAWVKNVQQTVYKLTESTKTKTGLVGHKKDHSSFYLSLFPQWPSVEVPNLKSINATYIRDLYFGLSERTSDLDSPLHYLEGQLAQEQLPPSVIEYLRNFRSTSFFEDIFQEHQFITQYRSSWDNTPYPVTFVTVDAVVVQSGHILLVERKARPGRGLWALPGGFIKPHERLIDACLRELREETRLKVPAAVLKGSVQKQAVFDDPYRSTRGRTITHAFHIELVPNPQLPKVRGGDDARHAMWIPLAQITPEQLFEDHYFIIQQMVGL